MKRNIDINIKKAGYFILGIMLLTLQFSCKKTLDVNHNPNYPADVTVKELLPAAQISISQVTGNYLQVVGGIWGQYWTQNPNASQYRQLEQYQPGPSSANVAWAELYAGALTDLKKIAEKGGTAANTRNYTAIAKILQGYTYQLLTDNFGDVPFTEALMGEDKKITSPKYDKQQDIYPAIIALVKEGRDLINVDGASPSTDDLIYGGDMGRWARFANTLLLRMYLRLAYIDAATAQAGVTELQSDPNGFLGVGETAQISYTSSPGNTNPLYSEMVGLGFTQNLVASATAVDSMAERGDVRIDAFYSGAAGLQQGFYNINPPGSYSTPTAAVGAAANDPSSATAPVKLISAYESLFLQAEAAARGWMGSSGETEYRSAIEANFTEYGLSGTDIEYYTDTLAVYPASGSMQEKIKFIITEKWYAMCGNQNIEAWTEWRRTGYPDFFTISPTNRTGDKFPQRIPYPETEITRNLNFPGQKDIGEKVWWDAN